MPSISDHHSSTLTKLLFLGDAKSGKTTALISLVAAGYHLRILDFDNLLDPLASRIRRQCPELAANVEYRSLRDTYTSTPTGYVVNGKPRAWTTSLEMLNHWKYNDIDLGIPATWGHECILVIDSLSRWCDAAYNYHEVMAPKGKSGDSDGRAIYGNAQDDVERALANLTNPTFETNVIVVCHGAYMENPDGTRKIYPQGIGMKLSPKIPQYFSTFVRLTKRGEKRTIQLKSDAMIDLANILPPDLADKDLSPDTGLAEIFAASKAAATPPRPKSVTLVRK